MEEMPSGHNNQITIALGKMLDDGFVLLNQAQEIVMANAMATRYLGENLVGQKVAVLVASVVEMMEIMAIMVLILIKKNVLKEVMISCLT